MPKSPKLRAIKLSGERCAELHAKEKELENLQTIFKSFSDDRWTKEGDQLRRIHNLEQSNQQLSANDAKHHQTITHLTKDIMVLAKEKDRDQNTIAHLVTMLYDA